MNIDIVEKNKYILLAEILLAIIVISFIAFVFTNKEESVKEVEEEIDVHFLSVKGKELVKDLDHIEVYTCLEEYEDYFSKCKKGTVYKTDDLNKINDIVDKIDNINSLDIVEQLPSNLVTSDYRGRPIIDFYYKDGYSTQLIFMDNYLIYIIRKSYGISETYYNYGNNSVTNYIKTIK